MWFYLQWVTQVYLASTTGRLWSILCPAAKVSFQKRSGHIIYPSVVENQILGLHACWQTPICIPHNNQTNDFVSLYRNTLYIKGSFVLLPCRPDDWFNHCPFFLLLIGEAGKRKQHFSNSCSARELDVMGSASWIYLFKIWDVEIRQGHIYMPSFWFLLSGKAMRNTWGFFASTPGPSLASRDNKSLEPLDEAFRSLGCSSRLPFSQFLDSSEVAKVEAIVLPLPVGDFHQ